MVGIQVLDMTIFHSLLANPFFIRSCPFLEKKIGEGTEVDYRMNLGIEEQLSLPCRDREKDSFLSLHYLNFKCK